jgi:transcriptional regulator with XRE-family HTH domain
MLNFNFVGEKFKRLREESGLTQGQVAEYLNVNQSYISRYEKNERQLSVDLLEKLSNLFGCSIDYFTSDDSQYKPIPFALRASCITSEDLETIAAINKIALNLRSMENILKGE